MPKRIAALEAAASRMAGFPVKVRVGRGRSLLPDGPLLRGFAILQFEAEMPTGGRWARTCAVRPSAFRDAPQMAEWMGEETGRVLAAAAEQEAG